MPDLHRSLANFRTALDEIRRAYPTEEDDEALNTTALGETTLEADILRALRSARIEEAEVAAAKIVIETIGKRAERKAAKAARLKTACLHAMQEAGIDKLPAPDMSVSVGLSPPKVIVTDQGALTPHFLRYHVEPDKKVIAEALKRGEQVPGAEMGNRAPFLRISTK